MPTLPTSTTPTLTLPTFALPTSTPLAPTLPMSTTPTPTPSTSTLSPSYLSECAFPTSDSPTSIDPTPTHLQSEDPLDIIITCSSPASYQGHNYLISSHQIIPSGNLSVESLKFSLLWDLVTTRFDLDNNEESAWGYQLTYEALDPEGAIVAVLNDTDLQDAVGKFIQRGYTSMTMELSTTQEGDPIDHHPSQLHDGVDHPSWTHDEADHPSWMHDGVDYPSQLHNGVDHPPWTRNGDDHLSRTHDEVGHPSWMHDGLDYPSQLHSGVDHPPLMPNGVIPRSLSSATSAWMKMFYGI
ncbi:MAG: hypothetical protein Q9170_005842 [Blastenia crenularia]